MRGEVTIMTTHAISLPGDEDTQQVARPATVADERPSAALRLDQMDLDPPTGPVPADVLAYFERALARESSRRAA